MSGTSSPSFEECGSLELDTPLQVIYLLIPSDILPPRKRLIVLVERPEPPKVICLLVLALPVLL